MIHFKFMLSIHSIETIYQTEFPPVLALQEDNTTSGGRKVPTFPRIFDIAIPRERERDKILFSTQWWRSPSSPWGPRAPPWRSTWRRAASRQRSAKAALLKYCWVGFIISYFINFTDRPDDLHCHFHHPYQAWHIKTPDIILNIKVNNLNIYKIMKKIQLFPNNVWISYLTTTSLVVSSVMKEKKIEKHLWSVNIWLHSFTLTLFEGHPTEICDPNRSWISSQQNNFHSFAAYQTKRKYIKFFQMSNYWLWQYI